MTNLTEAQIENLIAKARSAQSELEALLDGEDVHVSNDVGDFLSEIIDKLAEGTKSASTPPVAVIYDELGDDGAWHDGMYEIFDTEDEAARVFRDMAGPNPLHYSNPRIVHVRGVISPPEGQSWAEH